MLKTDNANRGEVIIYRPKAGEVEIEVKLEKETIWLTQEQVARLFSVQRPAITKHLKNIFESGELAENSVSSILEHTANDGKVYRTKFYNLDAVISVGYRVNSRQATQFRIWATKVLRNYLLDGYAINQKRLLAAGDKFHQLQNAIVFLKRKSEDKELESQTKGILNLLGDYAKTLTLLSQYDKNQIKEAKGGKSKFVLKYEDCRRIIMEVKKELKSKDEASELFGRE
ncbi:MAG: RhuM family protein, partial [Patescibacteria group bacterium]